MKETPARILYDREGNPVLVELDGSNYRLATRDEESADLLRAILHELRFMRMAMAEAFDTDLRMNDVDIEEML